MPLRADWELETETPQLFELALVDRYETANQLLASGGWDAAIYFYGYVAELILKAAYFRFLGNNISDPIASMLNPARVRGSQLHQLGFMPNIGHD